VETLLAVAIGGLFAAGLYLLLRRDLIKVVIGIGLLGHAVNLLLLTVGGLTRARPPLIPEGLNQPSAAFANPVPQALILTAIVIGFGLQAFALIVAHRTLQTAGTDDLDDLKTTDT
jgi:multicomponent Na+:H+ antiporter subunit C